MDPVAVTALAYTAETAVEGAVAAYFVTKATLPLKAKLEHVATRGSLERAYHSLTVIGTQALVFGGRTKSDNKASLTSNEVTILNVSTTESTTASVESVSPETTEQAEMPAPRARHTAVGARNRMFVFGGEGEDGKPIDEAGRIWVFDPAEMKWLFLDPPPETTFPGPRVGHASTTSDAGDIIFMHGGRDASDIDLDDTWAFPLEHGKWTQLSTTSGPARSSPSLSYAQNKLWRFGGVLPEEGNEPRDVLQFLRLPQLEPFVQAGLEPEKEHTLAGWESISVENVTSEEKDDAKEIFPPNRSMSALHHINTGQGREYMLVALGEDETKEAIGAKYLHDLWAYQLPSAMASGAGVKDAIRENIPKVESFKGQWAPVEITDVDIGDEEKRGGSWTGRGGFDSDVTGSKQFMLWGGIDEKGDVLGDGWIIKIE